MILALIGFAVGVLVGGCGVIVFSKNNKNHIAKYREEILAAVAKGEAEVAKVIDKVQGK
jgi:uncharacterized membrane protein YgaE (UPF0421/DUF939 family)